MTGLYEPIWRFFESIHNCMVEAWDWIVEKLSPYSRVLALFDLAILVFLLVIFLRARFQ